MRPGISYTPQGKPYMQNPGTFAFGRAQPKSSEKQQGPLAEPPKQNNQAAQQQFGSAQASGDYSAYAPSGGYSAYSPQIATPEYWGSQRNKQYPAQGRQQHGPQGQNSARTFYGADAPYIDGRTAKQSTEMRYRQPEPQSQSQGDGASGVVSWRDMFPQRQQPPVAMPAEEYRRLTPREQFEIGTQPGVTIDSEGNVRQDLEKVRSQYGTRIGQEGQAGTMDFIDSDRDGVDDRYQPAPGVRPQTGRPPQGGGQIHYGYGSQPVIQQPGTAAQPMPQQLRYGYGQAPTQPQSPPAYVPQAPQPQQYQPQQYVFPLQGQGQQFYNQRDAFINNINTSLGQQMMQNFGGSQPVAPQLNIPQLWNKAGQMAANGWTNPLAALIGNV